MSQSFYSDLGPLFMAWRLLDEALSQYVTAPAGNPRKKAWRSVDKARENMRRVMRNAGLRVDPAPSAPKSVGSGHE